MNLFPKSEVVIFDEAHQIPDIASEYFGESFSTRQLVIMEVMLLNLYRTKLTDVKQLGLAVEKLDKNAHEFRLLFSHDPERGNWRENRYPTINKCFASLKTNLDFLYLMIKLCIGRNEEIDNCFERASELLTKYAIMEQTQTFGISFWYETTPRHVVLHQTPLSVADKFKAYVDDSHAGWIFTSATLAVDGGFEHFC